MTRINSGIEPEELCDQHLLAEYREIGRVGALLEKRLQIAEPLKGQPAAFTLGRGHMLFFLDKGEYLRRRFEALRAEMQARGFEARLQWRNQWAAAPALNNDWQPGPEVRKALKERIAERMPAYPRFSPRR